MNYSFKTAVTYLSHFCVSSLSFTVKTPRPCESYDGCSQLGGGESDLACIWTGSSKTSGEQGPLSVSPVPTEVDLADQDQPLSFNHTRLAIAAAAFRGPSVQHGSSQTQNLARMLQCGLPNLVNTSVRQIVSTQCRETENVDGVVPDPKSDCEETERPPDKPSNTRTTEERTGHVLGLDCYSSSDEECDTWCFLIMTYNPQSSSFWITARVFIYFLSNLVDRSSCYGVGSQEHFFENYISQKKKNNLSLWCLFQIWDQCNVMWYQDCESLCETVIERSWIFLVKLKLHSTCKRKGLHASNTWVMVFISGWETHCNFQAFLHFCDQSSRPQLPPLCNRKKEDCVRSRQ